MYAGSPSSGVRLVRCRLSICPRDPLSMTQPILGVEVVARVKRLEAYSK